MPRGRLGIGVRTICPDCGAPTISFKSTKPTKLCDECYTRRKRRQSDRWKKEKGRESVVKNDSLALVVDSPDGSDYNPGVYLSYIKSSLKAGVLDTGMVLEWHGSRWRVCGSPGHRQTLEAV